MLELTFPPNRIPVLQPYSRDTAQPVGLPINGEVVPNRPTLYIFDLSNLADGDYVVDVDNPFGRFVMRKFGDSQLVAEEWWQLDYLTDPAKDPGKILVNHNYGGLKALTYAISGIPVADATIELFLYSDYITGKRNGNYRINDSRQRIDGTWAIPFYLDPQVYVIRYYRTNVAGPDSWKVVVSFNPSEIAITPLEVTNPEAVALGQGGQQAITAPAQLSDLITVDHNYGGEGKLMYKLHGVPVDGATIQFFKADEFNSGHRLDVNIVAQTSQTAAGVWSKPVKIPAGRYVMHCFKKNVAGPNSFNILVE